MNLDRKISLPSTSSPVADEWEVLDPTPDIHALFIQFNGEYFWGKLDGVEVKWSSRMTLCAGLCRYEGRGGLCSISLSVPLLKLRPRRDLVETLLHEMIHAYLFVTQNNRDREGHGPEFQSHMGRINRAAKTKITIYHSFHDEVRLYKQHWWKCSGPCQSRPPYYGLVKRSMNRTPGPNDFWWKEHQTTCGGTYTKIKEPEDYGKKRKAKENKQSTDKGKKIQMKDIRSFVTPKASTSGSQEVLIDLTESTQASSSQSSQKRTEATSAASNLTRIQATIAASNTTCTENKPPDVKPQTAHAIVPFSGRGFVLGSASTTNATQLSQAPLSFVKCPVCNANILESAINSHLDSCLSKFVT